MPMIDPPGLGGRLPLQPPALLDGARQALYKRLTERRATGRPFRNATDPTGVPDGLLTDAVSVTGWP